LQASLEVCALPESMWTTVATSVGPTRTTRRLIWAQDGRPIPSVVLPTPRVLCLRRCKYNQVMVKLSTVLLVTTFDVSQYIFVFCLFTKLKSQDYTVSGRLYIQQIQENAQLPFYWYKHPLTEISYSLQWCWSQTAQLCYPQVREGAAHQERQEDYRIRTPWR